MAHYLFKKEEKDEETKSYQETSLRVYRGGKKLLAMRWRTSPSFPSFSLDPLRPRPPPSHAAARRARSSTPPPYASDLRCDLRRVSAPGSRCDAAAAAKRLPVRFAWQLRLWVLLGSRWQWVNPHRIWTPQTHPHDNNMTPRVSPYLVAGGGISPDPYPSG
jgi:hypothetical protein